MLLGALNEVVFVALSTVPDTYSSDNFYFKKAFLLKVTAFVDWKNMKTEFFNVESPGRTMVISLICWTNNNYN